MTRLSVNINKVALLRNSRGSDFPNVVQVALDCERFGAEGITIHPRPDERHIKYQDAYDLKPVVTTELNIEGYPSERFMQMVTEVRPVQCTLVPDPPNTLTSDTGWDTIEHKAFLTDIIGELQSLGIRTSLFLEPDAKMLEGSKAVGTDCIEFYTGPYAHDFPKDKEAAIEPYAKAAIVANELGLGINAGHDLNLHNLAYFRQHLPNLVEVSIGHALIVDAMYYGLENTIQQYLYELR